MECANIRQFINQLFNVDQVSKYGKKSPQEQYARIVIELDDPRYVGHDIEIKASGNYLTKIFYDGSPDVFIRLNHRHSAKIFVTEFRRIQVPFGRIYLTNPVSQPGRKLILMVGYIYVGEIEPPLEVKLTTPGDRVEDGAGDRDFVGKPYQQSIITADVAAPFEPVTVKLRSVVIDNTHDSFSVMLGTHNIQVFELKAGSVLGLENIDMNLLYCRSKVAGNHVTLNLIGTYAK